MTKTEKCLQTLNKNKLHSRIPCTP